MLVDNSVDGDSRVQKSARYMASRGWDVTLLGRSPTAARRQYELEQATVILLPVNTPGSLHWNPHFRSWRHPLAYLDAADAERGARAQQWRRMDLQARRGAGESGLSLLPARVWHKLRGLLHGLRSRSTAKARERHRAGSPPPAVHGSRQWRWDEPMLADMDVVMGTEIAALKPDLIHAHDFRSLPTAMRAADRMAGSGRRPRVLYDAHEYLPGIVMAKPRALRGSVQAEAQCIPRVDAIVTVSDGIADQLVRGHGLAERPTVVANGPMRWDPATTPAPVTVRSQYGFDASTPVFVYLGNASAPRGVDTVIDALEHLPDVQLVMLTRRNGFLNSLLATARQRGYGDRITVRDYVSPDEVSPYISTATASLIPYLSDESQINHNLTIPNKLFEAIQAGTPVIVSDIRSTSDFVRAHGVGTTFTARDVDGFVAAAREVIRDEALIRERIVTSGLQDQYSWESQCAPVDAIYRRLTGASPDAGAAALRRAGQEFVDGERFDEVIVGSRIETRDSVVHLVFRREKENRHA